MARMCYHTLFPGPRVFFCVFFFLLLLSLGVWGVVGVCFK